MVCSYVFDEAGPVYIYLRRHTCPRCGKRISTSYRNKCIPMKEARRRHARMPMNGTPLFEETYEIRYPVFWCRHCNHTLTVSEMKAWEQERKAAGREEKQK